MISNPQQAVTKQTQADRTGLWAAASIYISLMTDISCGQHDIKHDEKLIKHLRRKIK